MGGGGLSLSSPWEYCFWQAWPDLSRGQFLHLCLMAPNISLMHNAACQYGEQNIDQMPVSLWHLLGMLPDGAVHFQMEADFWNWFMELLRWWCPNLLCSHLWWSRVGIPKVIATGNASTPFPLHQTPDHVILYPYAILLLLLLLFNSLLCDLYMNGYPCANKYVLLGQHKVSHCKVVPKDGVSICRFLLGSDNAETRPCQGAPKC